jgi:uncharacterized membrane protein YczE
MSGPRSARSARARRAQQARQRDRARRSSKKQHGGDPVVERRRRQELAEQGLGRGSKKRKEKQERAGAQRARSERGNGGGSGRRSRESSSRASRLLIPIDLRTVAWRLPQCAFGVALAGMAFAMLVRARLGLGPWEVLADGVHRQSGLSLGWSAVLIGIVALLVWVPLRQPMGLGTVVAVAVFGPTADATLPLLPSAAEVAARIAYLAGAVVIWSLGIAVYLSAGLGPGPRDGIMTAFVRRGRSVRVVRTVKEVVVLAMGMAMGGAVGVGTVVYAFGIGPLLHAWLKVLPAWMRADRLVGQREP